MGGTATIIRKLPVNENGIVERQGTVPHGSTTTGGIPPRRLRLQYRDKRTVPYLIRPVPFPSETDNAGFFRCGLHARPFRRGPRRLRGMHGGSFGSNPRLSVVQVSLS